MSCSRANSRSSTSPYAAGDVFLLVTDGITESHGADREEFGEDRLIELFATLAAADTPVAGLVDAVNAAAAEHAAGRSTGRRSDGRRNQGDIGNSDSQFRIHSNSEC